MIFKPDPKVTFREVVTFKMSLKRLFHQLKKSRCLFRGRHGNRLSDKEGSLQEPAVFLKNVFSNPDRFKTVGFLTI